MNRKFHAVGAALLLVSTQFSAAQPSQIAQSSPEKSAANSNAKPESMKPLEAVYASLWVHRRTPNLPQPPQIALQLWRQNLPQLKRRDAKVDHYFIGLALSNNQQYAENEKLPHFWGAVLPGAAFGPSWDIVYKPSNDRVYIATIYDHPQNIFENRAATDMRSQAWALLIWETPVEKTSKNLRDEMLAANQSYPEPHAVLTGRFKLLKPASCAEIMSIKAVNANDGIRFLITVDCYEEPIEILYNSKTKKGTFVDPTKGDFSLERRVKE